MPVMMPQARDLRANAVLTQISIAYRNPEYIADTIFPAVYVTKQTDIIPFYAQSDWFRVEAGPIAEGGTAPLAGYRVDLTNTYHAMPEGLAHFVSAERRENEDSPFDSDEDATLFVTDQLMLRREFKFVNDLWKTGVWGADKTGGTDFVKFSNYGSSEPLEVLDAYKREVRRKIGRDPNVLVLGDLTYDRLVRHPDIVGKVALTQMGLVNQDMLAVLTGFDKVLVGKASYTASPEGTAEGSVTYTGLWDDDALMLYVSPRPSLREPSAGYTFFWMTKGMPQWIRKWTDAARLGDFIEARSYYHQKACATRAGLFLNDAAD